VKVAALCAGYGGLEMGLAMAGVDVDLAWYAEIDAHAASVMAHHHPDAPNLGDLTQIHDPDPVDIVTAGFPCQPVSMAGKRKGVNDERWLIDDVCSLARRAGAHWLILENVAGLLSANDGDAMARVVSALAANGFAAEWTCVRAADVGAPHRRLRWFCAADASVVGRAQGTGPGPSGTARLRRHGPDDDGGAAAADTDGTGSEACLRRPWGGIAGRREPVGGSRTAAADADRQGSQGRGAVRRARECAAGSGGVDPARWGPYADAIARWEPVVGRPAPEPTDDRRRLNPAFVEWMMGLPAGWVTDVVPGRSHQLRILGNGVVPQQAAYALGLLDRQAVAS
jgi:DNA (cytosine-5)-methyltransferase 1